ncbi:hypothetical protein OCU04_003945 [Sclerotinia nivalis]|uniref:DUF7918 domain-containing protein n=1 Tax=Sclerotinia nivalis TaxID=352851 RepID=A0A9X0DN85_9HELO|nr:hypothetical protein OCU04_003945 [Sclerotinia nivalis]
MTVLSGVAGLVGEIEVRFKRHQGKYYDEYVKLEPGEAIREPNHERYIIAEPGTKYYVEVTLREGFDFGKYDLIQAKLYMDEEEVSYADFEPSKHGFDGRKTKKDLVKNIRYANVEIDGQRRGSMFIFGNMEMGKDKHLSKETDDMSIPPHSSLTITVYFVFYESVTVALSDDEYEEAISNWKGCSKLRSASNNSTEHEPEKPKRTMTSLQCGQCIDEFKFYPRSAEFLEKVNIVKYPPSLYLFDWNALNREERKSAIEDLQALERSHWDGIKENEDGQGFQSKSSRRRTYPKRNEPKEWRSWGKMYDNEKRQAFEILKERLKARERGEVHFEYINIDGKVISFGEEAEARELAPAEGMPAAVPFEDNMETPVVRKLSTVTQLEQDMEARPAEETPTAITKPKPEDIRNSLPDNFNARTVDVPPQMKTEYTNVISLDSDDDIIFVSETKVPKVQRSTGPSQAIKQDTTESVDEELQQLNELQKLKEEKENLKRDIELLEKKRKIDEITKKIEDAEKKAKAKKIKTE